MLSPILNTGHALSLNAPKLQNRNPPTPRP